MNAWPGRLAARRSLPLAVWLLLLPAVREGWAAPRPELEPRVPLARTASGADRLLEQPFGQPWRFHDDREDVFSRDELLALPGTRAVLLRRDAVEVALWGNLSQQSTFPGLESAVVLHDGAAYDLDCSLRRGRLLLTNRKERGAARVWLRLPGAGWEITLPQPKDAVALETYSRWPAGSSFSREPRPTGAPTASVVLLVLRGEPELATGSVRHRLTAPPGPAYFHWDSVAGPAAGPERLDRPPAWAAETPETAEDRALAAVRLQFDQLARSREPRAALLDLLAAADRAEERDRADLLRRFALFGLGALDDVASLMDALGDPAHPAARADAVLALRHWIAHDGGRDRLLFDLLAQHLAYPAVQAETVLVLLHSPFDPDAPDTYSALIAYLDHPRAAVRELAYWHLQRLDPAGAKRIPFDAGAPEADRAKAVAAWKERIPNGQLPPKGK